MFNFVMGAAICVVAGILGFLVRKRRPDNQAVKWLSWAGFALAFGIAVYYFG